MLNHKFKNTAVHIFEFRVGTSECVSHAPQKLHKKPRSTKMKMGKTPRRTSKWDSLGSCEIPKKFPGTPTPQTCRRTKFSKDDRKPTHRPLMRAALFESCASGAIQSLLAGGRPRAAPLGRKKEKWTKATAAGDIERMIDLEPKRTGMSLRYPPRTRGSRSPLRSHRCFPFCPMTSGSQILKPSNRRFRTARSKQTHGRSANSGPGKLWAQHHVRSKSGRFGPGVPPKIPGRPSRAPSAPPDVRDAKRDPDRLPSGPLHD